MLGECDNSLSTRTWDAFLFLNFCIRSDRSLANRKTDSFEQHESLQDQYFKHRASPHKETQSKLVRCQNYQSRLTLFVLKYVSIKNAFSMHQVAVHNEKGFANCGANRRL